MVGKRSLPERRNALLDPEHSPPHETLAERRRLGQTNLAVKPGVAGVAKTSKTENLGTFDYAHLRVPLPKDLNGSGIFTLKTSSSYPESYFLMRRSSDGYISATGMFKAAFPWASLHEEEAERRFQKTFPSAGPDEVAGSVWISPDEALRLSEEYGMRHWIVALLDPSPIEPGTKDKDKKHIQMPPRFDVDKAAPPPVVLPPTSSLRPTRARSSRSASPSKMATPSRKIASPRKPRATRSSVKPESVNGTEVKETTKATSTEEVEVTAGGAVEVMQEQTLEKTEEIVQNGIEVTDSASSSVNGEKKEIHIEVEEKIEQHGDVETHTTNVKINVPHDHPELPEPEDPTKMIEEAKRMVEEARALDKKAGAASGSQSKRKVEEVEEDEEAVLERPAKRTQYTTEQKLKKEKMTTRALFGIGVMAAIGTAFQYFA